ncbi:MAG: DUF2007 domain-containing protein [Deltaproteobacteria bacterium]|nr:DUF2007 domain-containing protein [Deltaproteobacteria bacterium]
MNGNDWEVVCSASGMTNAKIIAGRLETEGIPVELRYDAAGTIYALTVDGLGEVKITVPADQLERARDILNRSYDEKELDWEASEP